MSAENSPAISAGQKETFAGLADVLIPAGSGMPSGSEVLVGRGMLDQVLSIRPDVVEPLGKLLAEAEGRDAAAEVERLRTGDAEAYAMLTTVVGGGYFLDDEVRAAIGYEGQRAIPLPQPEVPDYEQDGLLQSVIDRGPIYRPTPPE